MFIHTPDTHLANSPLMLKAPKRGSIGTEGGGPESIMIYKERGRLTVEENIKMVKGDHHNAPHMQVLNLADRSKYGIPRRGARTGKESCIFSCPFLPLLPYRRVHSEPTGSSLVKLQGESPAS